MSKYKPYSKYKESGVAWLGDVPEGWEISKLKFFARIKNGQDQKKVIIDNGKYPIYGSGGEFGRANSYLYNKVSVLLGRKGTVDKPLFICEPFWAVDTMYFTKINSYTSPKFFYYACLTIPFAYYQYGSALPSMTQEDLHNHHFIAPSFKEQEAIANYLDQKTQKIDTLIKKQQTLIKLLKEKRQALISHVVTKGLDDSVEMKDSGVEWLGDVPTDWSLPKVSYIGDVTNGSTPNKNNKSYWTNGTIPWLASGCLNINEVITPTAFITQEAYINCSVKLIPSGSLLVGMVGQGKTRGTSALLGIDSCINQNLASIIPSNKISIKFLHFLFQAMYLNLREAGRGSNQSALNCDIIKSIKIPYPPLKEQQKIANHLDQKNKQIDTLIIKSTQAIELLKERRSALISAVVTGKIDVS